MNQEQLNRMREARGFVAALDQSGGSTPKALKTYGVQENQYKTDEEMFDLVHEMRTRIIKNDAFTAEKILGAILFEQTMDRYIEDMRTPDYLWDVKGIVPFVKVDQGLAEEQNGVQRMKPLTNLDSILEKASQRHVFGTKMRSVIKQNNPDGIKEVVAQQFEIAEQIIAHGLVPIVEPEIDIHMEDKAQAEDVLLQRMLEALEEVSQPVLLKLTLPTMKNFYQELVEHNKVIRVLALSGGYTLEESVELLAENGGVVASFSRALAENLQYGQSDEAFTSTLQHNIDEIYAASIS